MKTDKSSKTPDPIVAPDKKARSGSPLVASPSIAKREIGGLRRGQEERDATPTAGENDARASLI